MGILYNDYDYGRNSKNHVYFLHRILSDTSIELEILAKININSKYLYMISITSTSPINNNINNNNNAINSCWLTQQECMQSNPYEPTDKRLGEALKHFELSLDNLDDLDDPIDGIIS